MVIPFLTQPPHERTLTGRGSRVYPKGRGSRVLLLIRLKSFTNTLSAYGRPFLCGLHPTFT